MQLDELELEMTERNKYVQLRGRAHCDPCSEGIPRISNGLISPIETSHPFVFPRLDPASGRVVYYATTDDGRVVPAEDY